MGVSTFVVVTDPKWRFDTAHVFDALRETYVGQQITQGSDRSQLRADGFRDSWVVSVDDELTGLVIDAPAAQMLELVAWVRAYVPADVDLVVYDNDTFDVRPLPPGITTQRLGEDFWPDAPAMEERARKVPPTNEERRRATKPPHLP